MTKKRILISVTNNIVFDQRVLKIANTLYTNDYEVIIIGNSHQGKVKINKPYFCKIIPVLFKKSFPLFFEFNFKLLFYLFFKSKKNDVLWSNDLDTLIPNFIVSKIKNIKLIFDSHEFFSELPYVQNKFSQKIWRKIEQIIFPKLNNIITVSQGIQAEYKKKYNVNSELICNFPVKYNLNFSSDFKHNKKFIIYQGAINPFRGIDYLILAMKNINDLDLLIFGSGPKLNEYKLLVKNNNLQHKIFFFGNVKPEKLREITYQACFGVSLEENAGLSYYYSLPNKIFDYIHAEIPILATYLPETKKIITENKIGLIIENHSVEEITNKINLLKEIPKIEFIPFLKSAKQKYSWENQEQKILKIIK